MKRFSFLQNALLEWHAHRGRHHLTWRKKNITAYEVWVSEIMLQQTQVGRVSAYYEKFLARFPDVQTLAQTSWEDFLPYYEGLGYYRRGRNMLETARKIVSDFHGEFPQEQEVLKTLPGIGEYTADAIASFAFEKPVLAYDTNLKKLMGRFLNGSKDESVKKEDLEKQLFVSSRLLNSALMDFSSAVCKPKPECQNCVLAPQCRYFKEKGKKETAALPRTFSSQLKKFHEREASCLLWLHKNHQEYYSENPDAFEPFFLHPPYNTRAMIKQYFLERYQLKLAVRPPHKKEFSQGKPLIHVNAQILTGEHSFGVFDKQSARSVGADHYPPVNYVEFDNMTPKTTN